MSDTPLTERLYEEAAKDQWLRTPDGDFCAAYIASHGLPARDLLLEAAAEIEQLTRECDAYIEIERLTAERDVEGADDFGPPALKEWRERAERAETELAALVRYHESGVERAERAERERNEWKYEFKRLQTTHMEHHRKVAEGINSELKRERDEALDELTVVRDYTEARMTEEMRMGLHLKARAILARLRPQEPA